MQSEFQKTNRLLFLSNLFPDREDPVRGLDNATLLHALHSWWEIRVISPRPVFPPWKSIPQGCREEDTPFDPNYLPCPYLPKIGDRWNDRLMARALGPAFERAIDSFQPDAVLASWLYPDGCAVASLAAEAGVPVVLITQGSDTHRFLEFPIRRRKILGAIERSDAVICRSADLANRLEAAGANSEKLHVIYNGVDTAVFRKEDASAARRELGVEPGVPLMLFVGNFLPVKDPVFLIRAHAELNRRRARSGDLPPARLVCIGSGPLRPAMEAEIARQGNGAASELLSSVPPSKIARWMNAADLLCLSSLNEGFPNVILEAMASGLPFVSTDVGGISELVDASSMTALVPSGDFDAYVSALERIIGRPNPEGDENNPLSAGRFDPAWERAAEEYNRLLLSCRRFG